MQIANFYDRGTHNATETNRHSIQQRAQLLAQKHAVHDIFAKKLNPIGETSASTSTRIKRRARKARTRKEKVKAEAKAEAKAKAEADAAEKQESDIPVLNWKRENEMTSTLMSAEKILTAAKWNDKPFIFVFVGGSTVHIGLADKTHRICENAWADATAEKIQEEQITTELTTMLSKYNEIRTDTDDVRMLLAGSPTCINPVKFNERSTPDPDAKIEAQCKAIVEANPPTGSKYTFFNDATTEIETLDNGKLKWLVLLSDLHEKYGGLFKPSKSPVNGGHLILKQIENAVTASEMEWKIVCGNRNKEDYYCTDSTNAKKTIPLRYATKHVKIVSSSTLNTLNALKSGRDIVSAFPAWFESNAFLNTVFLVTAGYLEKTREENTRQVRAKIYKAVNALRSNPMRR